MDSSIWREDLLSSRYLSWIFYVGARTSDGCRSRSCRSPSSIISISNLSILLFFRIIIRHRHYHHSQFTKVPPTAFLSISILPHPHIRNMDLILDGIGSSSSTPSRKGKCLALNEVTLRWLEQNDSGVAGLRVSSENWIKGAGRILGNNTSLRKIEVNIEFEPSQRP